jgi:hypothetical protein
MEGNTSSKSTDIEYALRITFGIVHGVIITLFSFGFALFLQSGFALFGCILTPLLSLALTIFCNGCVEYVSQSSLNVTRILKTAWIPPLGVFCANIILLPLEMMPALGFTGPMHGLIATSILVNFILTTLLQVYAARDVQDVYSISSGSSVPT